METIVGTDDQREQVTHARKIVAVALVVRHGVITTSKNSLRTDGTVIAQTPHPAHDRRR